MQTTKANNQVILNSHLQILPIELWINIFSFLPLPSICHSLSYTCKYMYNITKKQEVKIILKAINESNLTFFFLK